MPIITEKYRGSIDYHLVYCELIQAARFRGLTTYQAIAQIMGLPLSGNQMGKEVGQILAEILDDEVKRGRPLLTAVAVSVSGSPGTGFYALARESGKLSGEGKAAELAFWEAERTAVYDVWGRKY